MPDAMFAEPGGPFSSTVLSRPQRTLTHHPNFDPNPNFDPKPNPHLNPSPSPNPSPNPSPQP